MATTKGVDEDDSLEHVDKHLNVCAAPGLFQLGCQQRIDSRAHWSENVVQNIPVIFAEMMKLSEKHSDDGQALIHKPVLKLGVMQKARTQVARRLMYRGRLDAASKKTFHYGAKELFLRAESAEQRHLAESGFDCYFTGCGSLKAFTRKYPGGSIKKSL
jgi:hypothetical protein